MREREREGESHTHSIELEEAKHTKQLLNREKAFSNLL